MFPIEAFYDSENVISISGYVLCLLFTLFAAHQINRLLTKKAKPCKEVVPKKLVTAQPKLSTILERLRNEPYIQTEILTLAQKWKIIKEQMRIILNQEGNEVYKGKEKLLSAIKPNERQVKQLRYAVVKLRIKLADWVDSIQEAQALNNAVVSKCYSRKSKCAMEKQGITLGIVEIKRQLHSLQLEIVECDKRAHSCAANAKQLEYAADKKYSNAEDNIAAVGIGNGLMLLCGALFAPFTGGTSLSVATGAAFGNTFFNGTSAIANKCSADNDMTSAIKELNEALRLSESISDNKQTLRKKENDISRLRKTENELNETCAVLNEVELYILQLIKSVEKRLCNIQDFEILLQQAIDNGDALSIILRALENEKNVGFFRKLLRRKPKYLNRTAKELMLKIHDKWDEIENSIMPNGTIARIQTGNTRLQLL